MSYSSTTRGFQNYINYANNTNSTNRIWMGVNIKKSTKLKNAIEQINLSYDNGMRGYILFSFNHNKDFIKGLDNLIKYDKDIFKY